MVIHLCPSWTSEVTILLKTSIWAKWPSITKVRLQVVRLMANEHQSARQIVPVAGQCWTNQIIRPQPWPLFSPFCHYWSLWFIAGQWSVWLELNHIHLHEYHRHHPRSSNQPTKALFRFIRWHFLTSLISMAGNVADMPHPESVRRPTTLWHPSSKRMERSGQFWLVKSVNEYQLKKGQIGEVLQCQHHSDTYLSKHDISPYMDIQKWLLYIQGDVSHIVA